MKKNIFIILLGTLLVLPLMAGPIRVSFRDSTITRGKTVYIPVWIDSSVTGLNVKSYELDINYTAGPLVIDSVITNGSMTESWGAPAFHLSSGKITIAGAGTTPLAGTGIFLYLKTSLPLTSTSTYASLQFVKAYFNEGTPTTIVRNGTITIQNLPVITVSPNTGLLTVGETLQFYVSGGKSPYSWYTTDPYVATINSSGLLTSQHGGVCAVVAVDSNGITDTTGLIEVRSFKLTIRDTTYLQGQTINIPIYISDLTLVDIKSGTFSVSYNANVLTALDMLTNGALLASFPAPVMHFASGKITVAFASDTMRLNSVGTSILAYIRFKITEVNTYATTLQLSDIMFNESITGNIRNGYFTPILRANLTVAPSTAILVAGDSLQFTVSGGATPPVVWSVSDTTLASISATGKLKALKSGIIHVLVIDSVGATGTSGNITLYDMRIRLLNVTGAAGDSVEVSVEIGSYSPGVFSTQLSLTHNQNYFTPIEIITAGTLFEGRLVAMATPTAGSVNITAAGAAPVTGPGVLLKIRYKISASAPLGSYPVNFAANLLNEGKPLALPTNGQITVGTTGVEDNQPNMPVEFSLNQNYPNPFNPNTNIGFRISDFGFVTLKIFDMLGKEVATLVNEVKQPGEYTVRWDASASGGFPSGVYYYRLQSGSPSISSGQSFIETKKLILMK
ncbi:MAG: hypothetical protein C0417_10240 [Chlorobiaceae bacterium]|nr:hypothetical protein [Chlorobiaceae bacterium]